MTSTILSRKQLNFAQISIVCLDILKQCLIDILHIHIKPTDLGKKIRLSSSLTAGKNKLSSEQNDLCCPSSPGVPDYSKFDVTLLYKLIRNLCSYLKPSKEWGKEPKTTDLTIADDIERIRLFRNKHYAHADSAEIPDSEFTDLWNEGKSLVHRLQVFTTANGCKTNYELKMTNISGRRIKYEEYTSYVDLFRAIYVEGPVELNCGETAHYKADIRIEESAFLSVSWEKVHGSARKQIDTSCEKYRGSTSRQLNIHSVCKEDEGGYRAFISRKIDHEIFSNTVFLHVQGEPPRLDNLVVTTEKEGIVIHYTYRVSEHSPTANAITWAKNKVQLDLTNAKYRGGGLKDDCFIITSPTEEDRGEYSCTVSNDVGSDLQCVVLGLPRPHLLSSTTTIHGSKTTINCRISSCPSPEEVQWQKSSNGTTFSSVDVKDPKYHGSNEDLCTPFLIIPKTTFDDCLYYRIIVRNKIGECKSDTFFLEVTGDRPNISNMACNLKDAHSVRLNCDVFLNEKSPQLQEVFWTKNKQKLDIPGSGGKLSGVTINDPSLIINKVNPHDAGEYQLTATNSVGESKSDVIVLGIPNAVLQKFEMKEDGSQYFAVIIKSTPVPFYVQWTMKENESDTFRPINTNLEEYKGSSNSFPNPVLVVKHNEKLESCIFQIEVRNLIGKIIQRIPGDKTIKSLKMDDKTVGNLNTFYNNRGFSVRFGKVFDELAEKFPDAKVNRLKDLIQNSFEIKDVKSLKEAKSARDCFRILQNESIFTPSDVIALQYLLRMTGCDELEKICIEYASAQNAMYFYEHQPGNGFKNVHFHVVANLRSYYTEYITKVRETVAAIVGCTVEEIIVNGYLYSNSFILVLSIKEIYLNKLLNLKRQDKDELGILYIDYFKVDGKPIYLERSEAGKEETKDKNTSYQKVLCSPKDVRTHPRKKFDFTDEGPGESKSGVKRRSIYSGKVRLPGNKKTRTSNAELEQEVSSVAVRMMPEINTKIETTVFQQLDTCMDKGKEETKDKNTRYQKVLYSPKDVR
nr:uncharacterized protein LOC117689028 isoform X4 [Crassostrea gigas]